MEKSASPTVFIEIGTFQFSKFEMKSTKKYLLLDESRTHFILLFFFSKEASICQQTKRVHFARLIDKLESIHALTIISIITIERHFGTQ